MNFNHYDHNQEGQSDSETVTQTETIQQPIVTLEYLLNQNKMKQIALSKATHLIELYKIELQVKEQDYQKQLENVKNHQKYNYQMMISQLEENIIKLERQLKLYEQKIKQHQRKPVQYPEMFNLNESACRAPRIARNTSSRQLSNQRKGTGRYSHAKTPSGHQTNSMKRSLSTFMTGEGSKQQDLYRIEKSFLIDYLLKGQERDEKMICSLDNQLLSQIDEMNEKISCIKTSDKFIEQFIKQIREPFGEIQNRLRQCKEIMKIQELLIQQLNRQVFQYQSVCSVTISSFEQIFSLGQDAKLSDYRQSRTVATDDSMMRYENMYEEYSDVIETTHESALNKIKHHKCFIKQKVAGMQTENKQLKRILDDMIKLIKTNKKMQAGNMGSIRSTHLHQQTELHNQKNKSQVFYRK